VNGGESADDALLEAGTAPDFWVTAEIPVEHGAISGIAVTPDGRRLMVSHYGDNSVSLIDTGERPVTWTTVETDEPFAIATAGTRGGRAYFTTVSPAYDSIVDLDVDANRIVAVHPVAHSVTDLAVSPDGMHVYASRTAINGADVAVVDTATGREDAIGIASVPGTTTECVRVSPDGRRLYVATNGPSGSELVVIDTRRKRVVRTVEIGSPIRDIALSPDGTTAYVASCGPDFGAVLDVVDTRSNVVTSTCKFSEIAGFVGQLALSRDGERAYLVGDDGVMVLSTLTHDVIGNLTVGSQPSCVIESPDGKHLYVADYAGTVTVLAIASSTTSVGEDDERTTPHEWALPELLQLEPTLI
jgi:DNA-binding beta-propeller fold protein YncE